MDLRRELLQSLACSYEDYKDFNPRKVEGTCEWFFNDDTFLRWRESNASTLLWVPAGPGCGKSVLSRAMIDEPWRLSSGRFTPIICYFFFKDGNEDQMTNTGALKAILHQILTQDTSDKLTQIALCHYMTHGTNLMSNFSKLWKVLIECAGSSQLVCVLDALDECRTESRRQLIDKLLDYFQQLSRTSNPYQTFWIKFLITGRPYDDLEASFRILYPVTSYLRLDGDDKYDHISGDIDRVIDAKLEQIANGFKKDHRDAISQRLKSAGNRTYLWLHLTFDIIQRSPAEYGRLGDIEVLLSTIPSEISDAYEYILERSKDQERAAILLQILLAALQPLTLDEANIALTLALRDSPYRRHTDLCESLWPRDTFKIVVRNMCGLFLSVYDSRLFFIHQTAREFLVDSNRQSKWHGRFNMPEAHNTMFQACVTYLRLEDLRQPSSGNTDNYSEGDFDSRLDVEFPLRPYAARNWLMHLRLADPYVTDQAVRGEVKLFEHERDTVFDYAWNCRPLSKTLDNEPRSHEANPFHFTLEKWSGLVLESYLGVRSILEHMFTQQNIDINELGKQGVYVALYAAIVAGHVYMVRMLFQQGAHVDMVCGDSGDSGLLPASAQCNGKTMRLLLEHHADVDLRNKDGQSALHLAANHSAWKAAQLLLDSGVNIDTQYEGLETALHAALGTHINQTYEADGYFFVKKLLAQGANVTLRDECVATVLHRATRGGKVDILKKFLKGSDTALPDETGFAALAEGSDWVHAKKLKFQVFLDALPDDNAQCSKCGTDPMTALVQGRSDLVQILIERGVNVFIPMPRYGTTIQAAIVGEVDLLTIQLLLDKGVSLDHLGGRFGTALQAASRLGRVDIVELLLDKGADINLQGGRYGTALCAASYTGNVELVEILLDRGAEINSQGSNSGTALQIASHLGSIEVVKVLLDKGADVNFQGNPYGTALCAASSAGNVEIVEILLDRGSEINLQGSYPGTALHSASGSGHSEVVKILLERGADVNLEVPPSRTALHAAIRNGHVKIVKMLLEHGALVNSKVGRYGTALEAAKDSKNPEIIKMLCMDGVDIDMSRPVGSRVPPVIVKHMEKSPINSELWGML